MESRERLGTALHISRSSGNLILDSLGVARIGETVRDAKGKKIGIVFDVFGPTTNPFIAIKPSIETPERLLGKALYVRNRRRKGT
jgi:RNA-binding protein